MSSLDFAGLDFAGLDDGMVVRDCFSVADGLPRGEGILDAARAAGDTALDSLACVAWPGRGRGAVLLGVVSLGFGVAALDLRLSGLSTSMDAG